MRIIHDETGFTDAASVVALGMFDGVHIGHQALIRAAVRAARELGAACIVSTFDRHPMSVLCPERAPEPLLTLEENLRKFEALGADWALVKPFTRAYGATPPEVFLREMTAGLRAKAVVAGQDYTFGDAGRGDARMLRAMSAELGYRAIIVPPVMDGEVVCSSTHIRALLAAGERDRADALLALRPDAAD